MQSVLVTLRAEANLETVQAQLKRCGVWGTPVEGVFGNDGARGIVLGAHSNSVSRAALMDIPGVTEVFGQSSAHPLVDTHKGRTYWIGDTLLGDLETPILMAGPCSVESESQIHEAARMVKRCGATVLRGGVFKPRSSPHSFAGHGIEALNWLASAAKEFELAVVTEVMSERHAEAVAKVADLVQVGSRNMQNFSLLREVGRLGKLVLLKRGMSATVHEWLLAGEHLLAAGASGVVFCERGIRSFDSSSRNLLDLTAVALLRHVYGVRVVVDPSHAVGRKDLIEPLSVASLAAGADGLLIEAHPDPGTALSDGPQALGPAELERVSDRLFQ